MTSRNAPPTIVGDDELALRESPPAPSGTSPTGTEAAGGGTEPTGPVHDVPIDWEALEDAFENNAPEVHSYLQLATGEVIRVVDGVADPQMHARIAADAGYLRVDPVSSREQYRWMERFIPMVENVELRGRLHQAIDGKGAFRRFKDVLMAHAEDRERWFTYRSERLKTFMDAWLTAHSLRAIPRPTWNPPDAPPPSGEAVAPPSREPKRRNADALRRHLREVGDALGPRDLDVLCAFADFLRARRVVRAAREDASPSNDASQESQNDGDDDGPPSERVERASAGDEETK